MKRDEKGRFVKLPKIKKICKYCEKEFYVDSYKKSRIYCSLKCFSLNNILPKTKKICKQCGKEFWVQPCRTFRKYCSHKCFTSTRIGENIGYQKGHDFTEEELKKMKENAKKRWKNEEYAKMMFKAFNRKPNKIEKTLNQLLEENNLPYKYVGDGEVWFGGKNPDFIQCNGKKKVLEVFGDYWHTKRVRSFWETEWGRKLHYQQYGFDCLVIWEHELKKNPNKVLTSIKNFEESVIE